MATPSEDPTTGTDRNGHTVIVQDGRAEMKLRQAEAQAAAAKYRAIVDND